MTWNDFITSLVIVLLSISTVAFVAGCQLMEINIVQRAVLENGEDTSTDKSGTTFDTLTPMFVVRTGVFK